MSPRFRKFVALFISGWLLVMSGGYSTLVAAEVEHDFQCVDGTPGQDAPEGDANCSHGCAVHLAAHLFTLPDHASLTGAGRKESGRAPAADFRRFYSICSSLFQPPKVLLA